MAEPTVGPRAPALLLSGLTALLCGTALVAPSFAEAQVAAATGPPPPPPAVAGAPATAAPHSPLPAPVGEQSGVVGRIVVQGNQRIDPETILSYLPISVGDHVDSAKIDEALKALFRTDLFSDLKID